MSAAGGMSEKASNATLGGQFPLGWSPAVLRKGHDNQARPREGCPHCQPSSSPLTTAMSPSGRASWKRKAFHWTLKHQWNVH